MEDCIFCKIADGVIPSEKVFENEDVIAFKDINPVTPIHILVIPKKHIESIVRLNSEEDYECVKSIHKAINEIAVKLNIADEGFRVVVNCGENGGQEVKHLHYHILAGKKLGTKIVEE